MADLQGDINEYAKARVTKGELEASVLSDMGLPGEKNVLDEIYDELQVPTEEDKATLRRIPDSIPWNAYREILHVFSVAEILLKKFASSKVVALIELAERFSYYGSTVVFVSIIASPLHMYFGSSITSKTNFIQYPLPASNRTGAGGADRQSGALGMGQRASTGLTTFYQFWQAGFKIIIGAH